MRRVAQALLEVSTRSRDFLGRFGGEEFILILPETDVPAATCVAERCRKLIVDLQIPHARSDIGHALTVSIGVATVVPSENAEHMAFIERVDRRLYRAKLSGRNCIVGAGVADADAMAGKNAA